MSVTYSVHGVKFYECVYVYDLYLGSNETKYLNVKSILMFYVIKI